MSAEIAKLRYLPLPRLIAGVVLATAVLVGGLLLVFPPKRAASYVDIPSVSLSIVVTITAIVIGAWIATLEFSAGTLQRTLTAESRRHRVLIAKAAAAGGAALLLGFAGAAAGGGLTHFAAVHAGADVDQGDLAKAVFAIIPSGIAAGLVGFGCGLLTRSLGGGLSIALAFVFVGDQLLTFVPGVQDYTFGQVTGDIVNGISGAGEVVHPVGVAAVLTVVWVTAINVPGWISFVQGDLK